ncbi:glycosyltransferase family 2 protein [Allorhizobium taibaishanense]|uniref:Glycosyltransferase 2-like domain-containing protein n=1 Tax=Allorhizobium taibaishanense TaxID=887144 RepID=A0A1Q9A2M3_9HYPH|nr:hypothetical protein [Allorhizobium taibaishanense]MBB4005782.1 hypothetical protein [Allorhizobium taibaishanense]OLP48831.1 hypothetical protein BJF91_16995 [Allorhizobium taibaishanense]
MKIKHYIVTYKNNPKLETCVESILNTPTEHDRSIYVIANHSLDCLPDRYPVKMLRNELRPDFSTGHLARNWNQALINGFVDLKSPDADLLILSQNDCEFETGYLDECIRLHQTYDLVTYGEGDNCISYAPRAVARVGLWDERFCNIGYQEADYLLRAAIYLRDKASINDGANHKRQHNPIDTVEKVTKRLPTGYDRKEESHMASMRYHRHTHDLFLAKWKRPPGDWADDYLSTQQHLLNHIYYPYFEADVETLAEQNYLAFL